MTKPRREPMPSVVLHRTHLSCGPKRIRHTFGSALIVGRERDADMAIVEDRVVRPIGAFELVQALRNQKTSNAVAGHEGKLAFEEVETAECGKLVEHQQ